MQHTSLPPAGAIARPTDGLAPGARTASVVLRPALEVLLLTLLAALLGGAALSRAVRVLSATLAGRLALATGRQAEWDGAWDKEDRAGNPAGPYRAPLIAARGHSPQAVYVEGGTMPGWVVRFFPNRGMRPAARPHPAPHPAHPLPDH